jgi:tetratricopeptide (TPR) repeat protein
MANLFSRFSKRARARRADSRAAELKEAGRLAAAIDHYTRAIAIDPSWSVPFYNLGLLYKYEGDWQRSLEANLRATELDPQDQAGWWNLGIAATALEQWDMARHAWRGAGIKVPAGDGPIDFPCGQTPIRLNPDADAEVVWSQRLDPARARLVNIPLADYCFGDVVLNDGAAVGHRKLGDDNVPVFNCLELLEASPFSTWVVLIELGDAEPDGTPSLDRLEELARERELAAEDWSRSVQMLCKACSEGMPHDHDDQDPREVKGPHRVAVAARSRAEVADLLAEWQPDSRDARIGSIEIELRRGD